MRCHDVDEFARRDHFCTLPELREVPLVAGDKVVGAGGGAFYELVVVRILGNTEGRRLDGVGPAVDELKHLLAKAPANFQFGTCQHFAVLGKDVA